MSRHTESNGDPTFYYDVLEDTMETIVVNQETGLVIVGRFSFHSRSTYTEVEFNYPDLKRQFGNSDLSPEEYVYLLPHVGFLDYQIEPRLTFYGRHISEISFSRVIEQVTDSTWVENLHEMVVWTRHVKSWLSTQFGLPHRIEPPVLLDENQWLSPGEIAHLDYWIYNYSWGEFGYTFHWETGASVHVHFDKSYQVCDWDGLRDECRYLRDVNQWQIMEKTRNHPYIEAVIDVLSTQYDYMAVRALVSPDLRRLIFDLPHWSTKAIVDVRPDCPRQPYRISRHDTLRKAYATAESLVHSLKLFLETENL